MISVQSNELNFPVVEELMISSEKVAHVQTNNPLDHALLVLLKTGYSAIPVLDAENKFQGVVSKSMILEETLGIEQFELDKLNDLTVDQVMNKDVPCLTKEHSMIDALHKLIDHPFICVTSDQGEFDGIITRRTILKQFSKYYHETLKRA
ncbi:cyclic-di-AMP-binding protein CbpB [Halobacillus sp. Marseille-P3879]|uniref:cyclic-di-AMP-binding protein CbpB n=1 Tax=Halobacillus TaxID=45667 RepID=UPI000C7E5FF5|nr:cyclic-di-AMP-binding protein CbpB [Halobacillus sp. Marseille-P3879]